MKRTLDILKPVLVIALVVGITRFVLAVAHADRTAVYLASLTAVELGGMLYLAARSAPDPKVTYLSLWAGNMILFGTCQLLIMAGMFYTYATGIPTLFHETERLRGFLGYDPTPMQHIGMHVLNWMIVAPAIATWIIGAPILYFSRRGTGGSISGTRPS